VAEQEYKYITVRLAESLHQIDLAECEGTAYGR
jgi:hypothetical protein